MLSDSGRITLDGFRGCVFVGGFSYADVLDSAKGWAGSIKYNASVKAQFEVQQWYMFTSFMPILIDYNIYTHYCNIP